MKTNTFFKHIATSSLALMIGLQAPFALGMLDKKDNPSAPQQYQNTQDPQHQLLRNRLLNELRVLSAGLSEHLRNIKADNSDNSDDSDDEISINGENFSIESKEGLDVEKQKQALNIPKRKFQAQDFRRLEFLLGKEDSLQIFALMIQNGLDIKDIMKDIQDAKDKHNQTYSKKNAFLDLKIKFADDYYKGDGSLKNAEVSEPEKIQDFSYKANYDYLHEGHPRREVHQLIKNLHPKQIKIFKTSDFLGGLSWFDFKEMKNDKGYRYLEWGTGRDVEIRIGKGVEEFVNKRSPSKGLVFVSHDGYTKFVFNRRYGIVNDEEKTSYTKDFLDTCFNSEEKNKRLTEILQQCHQLRKQSAPVFSEQTCNRFFDARFDLMVHLEENKGRSKFIKKCYQDSHLEVNESKGRLELLNDKNELISVVIPFEDLVECFKSVKKISFSYDSDQINQILFDKLSAKNVSHFQISKVDIPKLFKWIKETGSDTFNNRKEFSLTCLPYFSISSQPNYLEYVNTGVSVPEDPNGVKPLINFLKDHPTIERLNLAGLWFDVPTILEICKVLPNLKILVIGVGGYDVPGNFKFDNFIPYGSSMITLYKFSDTLKIEAELPKNAKLIVVSVLPTINNNEIKIKPYVGKELNTDLFDKEHMIIKGTKIVFEGKVKYNNDFQNKKMEKEIEIKKE